jgi:tetratricopeptide (TPR) repeat protein
LKTHAKQTASSNTIFTGPVTINLSPPSSQHGEKRGKETVRPGECRAFNLPYLRNEYFTGREDILQALEGGFKGRGLVQAISGMGGVGKTQTAQEYAYQHRGSYKTILWGKATTREMLTADFAAMAELLDLPEKNAGNQGETVKAVRKWLDDNDGWLLILDNADDLALVRDFIPVGGKGHILLTTRAHATGAISARHSLDKMSLQEGALFLLRRSKKIAAGAPLDGAPADLRSQAENLANELDGLPLALDQAAAYIEEKPTTIAKYTELYRSMGAKLRARRGDLPADHPESVPVTFSLAFEKVAGDSAAAADLLRYCAFLEADAIPEEIFSEGASELGEALAAAAALPDGVIDAISEAGRFSLLRYDPESRIVSIHRLVQDVLKDGMNDNLRRVYVEGVVRAVNKVFPTSEYLNWQLCSRLAPHARCLAGPIDELCFESPEAARILNQVGEYLNERAQYADAEPLIRRALAIREKAFGIEHASVASSLNNLAGLHYNLGKYAEAESIWKRAMAIMEKTGGDVTFSFATGLNNFAELCKKQGKYVEAEPLYQKALAINEKTLGQNHPDVAPGLNNLALLYSCQGKYEEAEQLHRRALEIREKALGSQHPEVANSIENLAAVYFNQGKYAEAEPLLQRALTMHEKGLGTDHPDMVLILENYATLLREMNRDDEAARLVTRAEEIRAKANLVNPN